MSDASGTVVWKWDQTEPFGDSVPNGDPNNTGNVLDFPFKFPGQYADRETSLAYNWMRDYDAAIDRYIQPEPLGLRGDINLFRYARDNSLTYIDPDANSAVTALGGLGGASGLGAISPGAALAGAGLAGYSLGTLIYPMIEPKLSSIIDYCLKNDPNDDFCKKRKQYCITFCQYELGMPGRRDNFGLFRACIRRCMNAAGCMDY